MRLVKIRYHPLLAYFTLACAISWLLWAPLWLPAFGMAGLPVLPFHHALGAAGPVAAAFIVSASESGSSGPSDLLRRMVLWRGREIWVGIALFAPFLLAAVAALGALLFAGETLSLKGLGQSGEFPRFSFIGFFLYNLFTFGYGEEVGWRGFALPHLQERFSALSATLLLSLGWALWHLPLFFYRPGYAGMDATGVAGWLFSLLTGAVLLTWLYNSSRGSLLVAALFHATVDIVFTSDMASPFVVNGIGALITFWGVAVLFIAGPALLSKSGKMIRDRESGQTLVTLNR